MVLQEFVVKNYHTIHGARLAYGMRNANISSNNHLVQCVFIKQYILCSTVKSLFLSVDHTLL